MKRLLPYRSYVEEDVLPMYALIDAQANEKTTDTGFGDDGVFVKVSAGDLNEDVIYSNNAYLGKTDYPHTHDAMYASNPLKVEAAASGEAPIGVTLYETAKYDENGESLLYNKEKRDRVHCVIPGQSTPILTRGVITVSARSIDGAALTVGGGFIISTTTAGKIEGVAAGTAGSLGTVLGTGTRAGQTDITDKFEGAFAMISLK